MFAEGSTVTPRPNLFLIGAMKSGTTSLDSYLASHPSIFMVPIKEPTHFVDGRELQSISPAAWRAGYWRDQTRYLDLFAEAEDAVIVGESSTNYSKLPEISGVARRLADFNPDASIVYIMRDPIQRTISHYWHMATWHSETREMLKAVKQEPSYRQVSHYAMQLAPYLECFGAERVKTLTLEGLKADPVGTMRDLFEWLEVDPTFELTNAEKRKNVTSTEVSQGQGLGLLRRIRRSRYWDAVGPLVPKPIRSLGKRLAERRVDRRRVSTTEVADFLRPSQQAETQELAQLLGREFPEWKTLYATADDDLPQAEV